MAVKKKKVTTKKGASKKNTSIKSASKKKTSLKKVSSKKATSKTSKKVSQKLLKPSVSQVAVGDTIPHFELEATSNTKVTPETFKGKNVVLYFYPKDNTPGCTMEGHDFSKLQKEFKKYNTLIYGVSRDSLKSHEGFKSKQGYTVDLISDPEEKLCRIFGVIKFKNMYGRQVLGVERSTFLIDSNNILKKEWRGVKVKGHAEAVLDYIKQRKS